MAPSLLSISLRDGTHGLVLSLHGEIDLSTEQLLIDSVEAALVQRPARLVLELGGVSFLDVRGLNAVIRAHHAANALGCHLQLRSVPSTVERLIAIAGVHELLEVAPRSGEVVDSV